jgi:hypothetical protein
MDRTKPLHKCVWCRSNGLKIGAHILLCRKIPPSLFSEREAVLSAILTDHMTHSDPNPLSPPLIPPDPFDTVNVLRLLRFNWATYIYNKKTDRIEWTGTHSILIRAANFLYNLLNKYAKDSQSLFPNRYSIVYPTSSPLITKYIPPQNTE